MPISMKDVAKDAGVSLGTVSKVVNNIPVNAENQRRVEASIKKLSYEVDQYARAFRTQKTNTVALIVPDLINPFFSLFTHYISEALTELDYKLILCNSLENSEREKTYINMAKQNKVDGIIGITYSDIDKDVTENLPYISLDRHFSKKIRCVASDSYNGGCIAAEKLISSGCQSLAFIRTGSTIPGETLKRGTGFIDTCINQKVACERFEIYMEEEDAVAERVQNFLKLHMHDGICEIDGIFASSDHLALNIVHQAKNVGLRVPEDLQIIGYDGLRSLNVSNYVVSSIKQPIDLLAETCVKNLMKLINKTEEVPYTTILPVSFVEGGTTK